MSDYKLSEDFVLWGSESWKERCEETPLELSDASVDELEADYPDISQFPFELFKSFIFKTIPKRIINSQKIFQNVINFIMNLPPNVELFLPEPTDIVKARLIPELQSTQLQYCLFYTYKVISTNNDANEMIKEELIVFLMMIIYTSRGDTCLYGLAILQHLSVSRFDALNQFQFIERMGMLFRYSLDLKIKARALMALQPFMFYSEDYQRKQRIMDQILHQFSTLDPIVKQAALSVISEYIQSSVKDLKNALRSDLINIGIECLKTHSPQFVGHICSIFAFLFKQNYEEYFVEVLAKKQIIGELSILSRNLNEAISIPALSLLYTIIKDIPSFHEHIIFFDIPRISCDIITNGKNKEKVCAFSLISLFLKLFDGNIIQSIVQSDVIYICFDMFHQISEENQIMFLQGIIHMFTFEQSVWESLDPDQMIEAVQEVSTISQSVSDLTDIIFSAISELS